MNIYHDNIRKYEALALKMAETLTELSVLRLVAFLFSATLIIVLASNGLTALVLIIAPLCVLGFGFLVNRYNKEAWQKRHTAFLKEINEQEILRSENKLSGFEDGRAFLTHDHPYISDLDIFGSHSLFQLINRTTADSGKILLAEWLSAPAPKATILERQEAVKELTPKLDWRQDFQASGMHFKHAESEYKKLLEWLEKPAGLLPHRVRYLVICVPLAVISTLAVVYFILHPLLYVNTPDFASLMPGIAPLIVSLLINSLVLRKAKPMAEEATENIHHNIKILGGYHSLITRIESEKFHSGILQRLQSIFSHKNYSAAGEIKKLLRVLEIFQQRGVKKEAVSGNAFYGAFNILWFLDIYLIIQTEKWKRKNITYLKDWALAVSEFEVLSSLAGFHYSNPSYTFPEIKEEPYCIQFEMLGHPLIQAEQRVSNSFSLNGRGEIAMITGSNMAGKSTFLRTVGVNLVLAFMGAPCCANSGQVSNMKVFTSMRTQDNLEEGISSFRAELKRIEQLLNLIKSGEPIFFLLDEMFKGTNSQDRYKGGVSLIRQLSDLNAFGIISTHDLELARLAGNHMIVVNYSFNSTIEDGEMIFSYKLTDGICRDFNASELMKRSGIKILSDIDGLQ